MNEDTTQAAQHHADMLAYMQQAEDALRAARSRPLDENEISVIAFFAGLDPKEKK